MGKNTKEGYRKGQTKDRTQVHNPVTGLYIKINTSTGKFMASKKEPFKGVRMKKK